MRRLSDGWDFKQYVLGMLFYRYISENFVKYVNAGEIEAGNADFAFIMHSLAWLATNGYSLSVSAYVEQKDTREKIDIVKLNAEIKEIIAREEVLRAEMDRIIAEIEVEA